MPCVRGHPRDVAVLTISSLSKEYVRVRVAAKNAGAVVNPTADVVEMAFTLADAEPTTPDWKTASWETDAATEPDTYFARCLVGPGGTVTLADGTYQVWVRVTDSPEIPVKKSGVLVVV
jgi:hypothetical protein